MVAPKVDYLLDTLEFPLCRISAPEGCDPTRIDPDSFYAHTDSLLQLHEPFALLYDLRHSGALSAERRQRFARYVTANEALVSRYLVAFASVVETSWQQGLLTAVLWILRPPRPQRAFTEEREAVDWLGRQLQAANLGD